MKELVVISGKGGTGKTSITASLAVLAGRCVVADCDVDAADLHLVLSPEVLDRHDFYSGHQAVIREEDCSGCGACLAHCRFGAISSRAPAEELDGGLRAARYDCENCIVCRRSCPARANDMIHAMSVAMRAAGGGGFVVDPVACEGCGVCVNLCPEKAIDFRPRLCGEWFVSQTRCGTMVHAKLGIAQSNSGKLVSTVRQEARRAAEKQGVPMIIVDGPPGIGCPLIASVTGASMVLAVAEPTLSGEHDLKRVLQLARHFGIPSALCINKWDLNPDISARIEAYCREQSVPLAGRIRYDRAFTHAQIQRQAVVEMSEDGVAADIRAVWAAVAAQLECGRAEVRA